MEGGQASELPQHLPLSVAAAAAGEGGNVEGLEGGEAVEGGQGLGSGRVQGEVRDAGAGREPHVHHRAQASYSRGDVQPPQACRKVDSGCSVIGPRRADYPPGEARARGGEGGGLRERCGEVGRTELEAGRGCLCRQVSQALRGT